MPKQWFAIALNPDKTTMSNTDMIFTMFSNDNNGSHCDAQDRWSDSKTTIPPRLDTEVGGSNDITNVTFAQNKEDGVVIKSCSFTRKLITGDDKDCDIRMDGPMRLSIAFGDIDGGGDFAKHVKTIRGITLNFAEVNGGTSTRPGSGYFDGSTRSLQHVPDVNRSQDLIFWHATLMIIAWFVLMIPMTFLARYMKASVPTWFSLHWKLQAFACIATLVGVVLALISLDWKAYVDTHVVIGFIVFCLLFVQVTLGYLSNALFYEGKPPGVWDKSHWWVGRLILVLGCVNIYFGIVSFSEAVTDSNSQSSIESDLIAWYASAIVLLMASFILAETFMGQKHEYQLVNSYSDINIADTCKSLQDQLKSMRTRCSHWIESTQLYGIQVVVILSILTWTAVAGVSVGMIVVLCTAP